MGCEKVTAKEKKEMKTSEGLTLHFNSYFLLVLCSSMYLTSQAFIFSQKVYIRKGTDE